MTEEINYTVNTMGYSDFELENLYSNFFAYDMVKYSPNLDDAVSSGENKTEQK